MGYAKGTISISKLYDAHADEFTDEMTAVVKLPTEGGEQDVRIFSLRGCHLLAMFARTPVAKAFRKWVLDVLDRLERQSISAADAPLTPDQQCTLQAIVKAKIEALPESARRNRGLYPQIWSRFNNHCRLAQYRQLPQCRLSEAIAYLTQLDLAPVAPRALPKPKGPRPMNLDVLMTEVVSMRNAARIVAAPQGFVANDRTASDHATLQKHIGAIIDASLFMAEHAMVVAKRLQS